MSLYAWILLGTITGPLLLSFDKKVAFYRRWKALFPAILLVAIAFIVWDAYFTREGVWGFNPASVSGSYWAGLPVEECLFFLFVPYACVFIYEVLRAWLPKRRTALTARIFAFTIVFSGMLLGAMHTENWYTASACITASLLVLGLYFVAKVKWFGDFVLMFLVVLLPFLVVNGLLTGAFTEKPVVWYDEQHVVGFRIGTIPLEDLYYNLCLLLPVVAVYEWLKSTDLSRRTS